MKIARVGVLIEKRAAERRWSYGLNAFETYIEEILAHAGIPFETIDEVGKVNDRPYDIIIAAVVEERREKLAPLWSFAEQGGTIVSYGGLNPLAIKLGSVPTDHIATGYAKLGEAYEKAEFLRFLGAQPWQTAQAGESLLEEAGVVVRQEPNSTPLGAARQRFAIGAGALERWSVDIVNTIVRLQQGTEPVLTDGVPAPDGTAQLQEDILKADDRVALDWQWDRLETETGSPYYAYPYADYWREVLLGHLIRLCVDKGLTLPFVGLWPEGVKQVAMLSHDSDGNDDAHAIATMNMMAEIGVHSTWCMLEPGYSPAIYEQVKQAGHELAFHYNALETQRGQWGEEEFLRQLAWLRSAAQIDEVSSNKNHYTRYEGWGEQFEFCEKGGVRSDQTRGPSKKGNVGFLFGTCHPYYPIAWANDRNRLYDVVEISFLTQDLDLAPHWADSSVIEPFLDRVRSVEGVAHFLFHQVHICNKDSVRDAVRKMANEARKREFVFWTCKQINDWHRARRRVKIDSVDGSGQVKLTGDKPAGAIVWIPVTDSAPQGDYEVRYGVKCRKQVCEQVNV